MNRARLVFAQFQFLLSLMFILFSERNLLLAAFALFKQFNYNQSCPAVVFINAEIIMFKDLSHSNNFVFILETQDLYMVCIKLL